MAPNYIEKEAVVNPGKTTTVDVRVKPLGAIAGVVENVSTESLLKGVRIQLLDTSGNVQQDTTTGDDGSYRFRGLPGGTYSVRMILPKGYLVQGEAEQLVDLQGSQEVRADFQVYRHGAMEGRVMTEDGQPLPDAEVSLIDSTGAVLRTVRTDERGAYSFLDVPVDKYKVRVSVPDALEA
jgi:uncharacterized surface anchored protein